MNRDQRKQVLSTVIFGALWLGAHPLLAQVANPANEAERPQEPAEQAQPASEPPGHLPSWKVTGDPVTVIGKAPLREEDLIGPYRQPRWKARRRFGETRVYVIPEGDVQFEYWLVPKLKRDGQETEVRPLPQAHLDIVLLAGLNEDAPRTKGIFIFGWEL